MDYDGDIAIGAIMIYAEEVGHYWRTSRSSIDTWTERARRQIEKLGGEVLAEGFGSEPTTGNAAFMLAFEIAGDKFKIIWPVLPSKSGDEKAAKVQAATMLYHDVKAKSISAAILGPRVAFFSFLMLPDGRTAAEATAPELMEGIPALFASNGPLQIEGDVVEGDWNET